jgi:hypothetical protein
MDFASTALTNSQAGTASSAGRRRYDHPSPISHDAIAKMIADNAASRGAEEWEDEPITFHA